MHSPPFIPENQQRKGQTRFGNDPIQMIQCLIGQAIFIEHNGTAMLRSEWAHTPLSHDDRLEILRVAAGEIRVMLPGKTAPRGLDRGLRGAAGHAQDVMGFSLGHEPSVPTGFGRPTFDRRSGRASP
jgi:hypothetical protein